MFDEETLEKVTMEMLQELEYEVVNGYELVRTDFSKVLLEEDIVQAIERINKGIKDSKETIKDTIKNGSILKVVGALDSSRGLRTHATLLDEVRRKKDKNCKTFPNNL